MYSLKQKLKTHLRIVMVETSHPGNIGAAARALKNMGQKRLYLVNPQQFPNVQATARAAGADDLLKEAVITETVAEALQGCQRVFACSARQRHLSWPVVTPKSSAPLIIESIEQGDEVGLLFGNEQSGLDNDLFKYCHYHLHIPTNPNYSSLNLAAAIQVVAYEIYQAANQYETDTLGSASQASNPEKTQTESLAPIEVLDDFYKHLEKVLWDIKFLKPDHPKRLMRRLQRLFNRAQLEKTEINILRGILTSIEYASQTKNQSKKHNE